jgi:hypothetical protein
MRWLVVLGGLSSEILLSHQALIPFLQHSSLYRRHLYSRAHCKLLTDMYHTQVCNTTY